MNVFTSHFQRNCASEKFCFYVEHLECWEKQNINVIKSNLSSAEFISKAKNPYTLSNTSSEEADRLLPQGAVLPHVSLYFSLVTLQQSISSLLNPHRMAVSIRDQENATMSLWPEMQLSSDQTSEPGTFRSVACLFMQCKPSINFGHRAKNSSKKAKQTQISGPSELVFFFFLLFFFFTWNFFISHQISTNARLEPTTATGMRPAPIQRAASNATVRQVGLAMASNAQVIEWNRQRCGYGPF